MDEDYCLYVGIDDDDNDDDGGSFQRPYEPRPSRAAEGGESSMSDSGEEPTGSSSSSFHHPSQEKAAFTRLDKQYNEDQTIKIVEFAGNRRNKQLSSLGCLSKTV